MMSHDDMMGCIATEAHEACCTVSPTGVEYHKVSHTPWTEHLRVWFINLYHWRTRWAVSHLSKQIQRDPGFRQSWHANIAMPIYDATRPQCYCDKLLFNPKDVPPLHYPNCELSQAATVPRRFEHREMSIEQANYIADRLMKHLFGA